jgi:tetratricopeptide (TPR) repeat protein
MHQSNYARAVQMLEQTLALQVQLLPEGHPDIAGNRANLAEALQRLGRYEAAEAMYREALSSMRRSRGPDHPFVATIMNNLARTLRSRGRFAEARTLLLDALAIRRSQLGPRHELVAMSLSDLGTVTESLGDIEAAKAFFEEALALLPREHVWRGPILNHVGRVLRIHGDLSAAERALRESVDLNRKAYGTDHDVVGTSLMQLGLVLHAQKREKEAESALLEALRIFQLRLDPTHPYKSEAMLALTEVQAARRQPRRTGA